MKLRNVLAASLIGVSLLALAGCGAPSTRVAVMPNSTPAAGTVVGEGFDLKCDPSLQTVTVDYIDGETTRWQGTDIEFKQDFLTDANDRARQTSVTIIVKGNINAKSAVVHPNQAYYDSESKYTSLPMAPIAVSWPYDPSQVSAQFGSFDFTNVNEIDYIDLCVTPKAE